MKKLVMFLCCVFAFGVTDGFAACQLYSCGGHDGINQMVDNSGSQCFYCRNNYAGNKQCASDDIVGRINYKGEIITLVQCHGSLLENDNWNPYNPGYLCPNSPLDHDPKTLPPHSYIIYSLNGGKKTQGFVSGDDTVLKAGSTACVYIKCEEGYAPSADKKACVETNSKCKTLNGDFLVVGATAKIECEKNASTIIGSLASGGALASLDHVITGDMSKCTATCKADGWDITLKDDDSCRSADWVADTSKKKCVESQASIDRRNRAARDRRNAENQRNEDACTQTGGQWLNGKCICDANAHLQPLVQDKTCECMSGYNFENNRCVITNLQARKEACDRSDEAYWNDITNTCVCKNPDPTYTFNYNTLRCEQDPRYIACVNASNTKWIDGVCQCTKTGYEWDGKKCIEGDDLIRAREEAARKQRVDSVRAKITNASKKLGDIMAGLKVTVWKNAEGNFNTARLASDSIAGVVLGTAGGLITSHLVKKGQVKAGFEDIQCTVGGQKVADWGDEFTVGIQ